MSIDNLRLRTKNLIPLAVLALTVIGMSAFGATNLIGISAAASDIIEKRDQATFKISRAGRMVLLSPAAVNAAILNDDQSQESAAASKDLETAPRRANELLKGAAEALPEQATEIEKFTQGATDIGRRATEIFKAQQGLPGVDAGRSIKPEELEALAKITKQAAQLSQDARVLVSEMTDYDDRMLDENAEAVKKLHARSRNATLTLVVLGALATLLAAGISFWMTSTKIEKPLRRLLDQMRALASGNATLAIDGLDRKDEVGEMAKAVDVFRTNAVERLRAEHEAVANRQAAEAERDRAAQERARVVEAQGAAVDALREGLKRLADGNLTVRLDSGFAAEFVEIRNDFNAAVTKLKAALAAVADSTGAIHSSTREISSASDNLSQRTEQQAASLEETAAALEEITTTLKNSAQGAQHAAEVVAAADADAKKGAVVVRQAVEAMDAIATSSNQIGQIIGVIDEIAFQTNLLALNAGVEAARAGDSGKGFAVVASEVRALAQRSAEAAKEIKALVSTSGAQVETGVKLVAESGKALDSIISQVSEINKVVAQIASGAQQQATGLQQINAAINQMDQSTQQNATMVEESTAASHSLNQEMNQLTRLMEQFRVREAGEDRLRRDLKAAAPHAFAKPPSAARAAPAKPTPAAPRRAPKIAAVRAHSGADWTEF